MEPFVAFSIAGTVILLGFIGEWIFEKTNIPDPIWLMLFGILLGNTYSFKDHAAFVEVSTLFTLFALIFILFEGVLNTDLRSIFFGVVRGGGVSVLSFIITTMATALFMKGLGWGWLEGLLLGVVVSDSAQAIIIPLLKKLNVSTETYSVLTFESAISDVFGIVGAVTIINIILLGNINVTDIVQRLTQTFSVSLVMGIILGLAWVPIHQWMNRFSKSYITTIGTLLLVYSLVEYLGANGPLACLTFGIIIANSRQIFSLFKKPQESLTPGAKFFYSEISFFVKSFFFVYLGFVFNLRDINILVVGIALTLLIFVLRPLSVRLSGIHKIVSSKERTYIEVMNPKGTAAAVLAQLPLQYGLPIAEVFSTLVLAVITTSILACILFVFLAKNDHFRGFIGEPERVGAAAKAAAAGTPSSQGKPPSRANPPSSP